MSRSELGDVVVDDPLGEALDDGGLADARLADEHRVVLGAAAEDLHHPLDLVCAADHRVELALSASLVRSRPNWSRTLAARLPSELPVLPCALRRPGPLSAQRDLVADLLGLGVQVEQDARGDALVLAHEAEEDVLGADVVVAEAAGPHEAPARGLSWRAA